MPPAGGQGPRKIASIGVHVSRWVTTHGYALNVDLDPAPFTEWITACGLEDAQFTTMAGSSAAGRRRRRAPRGDSGDRGGLRARARRAPSRRRRRSLAAVDPRLARGAVTVDTRPIPRPGWDPLPYEGCVGVVGRVLVREATYFVAELRFSEHATIHEHPGDNDTIVVCLEGEGTRRSQGRPQATRGSTGPVAQGRPAPALDGTLDHDDAHDRALRLISPPGTPRQAIGLSSAKRA